MNPLLIVIQLVKSINYQNQQKSDLITEGWRGKDIDKTTNRYLVRYSDQILKT